MIMKTITVVEVLLAMVVGVRMVESILIMVMPMMMKRMDVMMMATIVPFIMTLKRRK